MSRSVERIFVLVLLAASFPAAHLAHAQEAISSPPTQTAPGSTYVNTKEGLQQLLQDMRAASQARDQEKLAAFLKEMEIPNCDAWLHKMYDAEKADSWMSSCDPKTIASNEKFMQERFLQHAAAADEEISTRKVNDNPEPGKGLEWGWMQAIRAPLDIYFASWKKSNEPQDARGEPIGYFVFVDGSFRWDNRIIFIKPKVTHAKVVPARLIKKVNPDYPPASQHISGVVRVNFVIGTDGAVHNAHAISGEGLSDNPSLMKAAEAAVTQWRYQPATVDGKPAQTNGAVDVTFPPRI